MAVFSVTLHLVAQYGQGAKEGWYDGAAIGFAVILVIMVTGKMRLECTASSHRWIYHSIFALLDVSVEWAGSLQRLQAIPAISKSQC